MTFAVGLTGGIASGKSKVAELFAEWGATIIDTDIIARELVQPHQLAWEAIVDHFGPSIVHQDESLNRKALREKIFDDEAERQWLEHLLHPLIREQVKKQLAQVKSAYAIVVIPLLKNKRDYPYLHKIIVVDSSQDEQLKRLIERDHIPESLALTMIQSQLSRQARNQLADFIIVNDRDWQYLKVQVERLDRLFKA